MVKDRSGSEPGVIFKPDPLAGAEQVGTVEADPDTQQQRVDEDHGVDQVKGPDEQESVESAPVHQAASA